MYTRGQIKRTQVPVILKAGRQTRSIMERPPASPTATKFRIQLALVLLTILCGPIGINLTYAFQFADLSPSYSSLASAIRAFGFFAPMFWFGVALFTPLMTAAAIWDKSGFPLKHDIRLFIALWFVSWGSLWLGPSMINLRQPGLIRITERAKPVIAAIEKYNTEEGHYPANLQALVPRYLPAIPRTGAVGYPEFKYEVTGTASSETNLFQKYQLYVYTTYGLNFDSFVYWPEKQYPFYLYGGTTELIGDWAYINE